MVTIVAVVQQADPGPGEVVQPVPVGVRLRDEEPAVETTGTVATRHHVCTEHIIIFLPTILSR